MNYFPDPPRLVLLCHKLQRERPFVFAPQHGQRERTVTSLAMSRRRKVAMEFGTWRSGRSGGASGSVMKKEKIDSLHELLKRKR